MPHPFRTYSATGRLPVFDAQLGWHYPKAHAADDWASPADFHVTPLPSQTPRAVNVGSPFNAAVRSWMGSNPNLSYHAALLEVARRMPDLAADYTAALSAVPSTQGD